MKFLSIDFTTSSNCLDISESSVAWPPLIAVYIALFRCSLSKSNAALSIANCLSLFIFESVPLSLHDILGRIGVDKYYPIKTSTCFLTKGINSTEVGVPIP